MEDARINILLVDDKPEKVLALEAVLETLGQNIVRAYSGREGLRCLLNQTFAVILLDVNMPGMDGFETAALIRQRPSTQGVPIIFVTAMDDETHVSQGYSLGAVDYIQTPIVPEVLRAKVSVFVDLFRKSEQVRLQAASLSQRAAQLHKLTGASLAIHSASTMEQMFGVLTSTARDVTSAEYSRAILFTGPASEHATIVSSTSAATESRQMEGYRPNGSGLHALVCQTGKPIRLTRKDLETHAEWQPMNGDAGLWHASGGWLAAPLTARDGRNLGLIEVSQKAAGEFSGDDQAMLVQLAQMGSIAIENTLYAAERETNRIKDEFLSTLSHELRTPLNAILGWTQLLKSEPLDPELAHGLEIIDRNARSQTKLIDDLLDVSRITTGKLQLNLRPTVLTPVVRAATDSIRPAVEAKRITIDCDFSCADIVIDADADRLQQVFWNLLANATKFTPEEGRIVVSLERGEQMVQLRVSDTGRGISPAFLPYVFDRFRQADSTSTRSHGGLGIGLTIVRHIVQLHGGTVEAESAGEGRGATFIVTLPIASSPKTSPRGKDLPAASASDGPAVADLTGIRILAVDDEHDTREVLGATLSRFGASVTTAASVDEALVEFSRAVFDVVISDIAMPDRDGFDLIRAIRARGVDAGGNVPAVALTAYARNEDRDRALAAGFQCHMAKPLNPAALLATVLELHTPAAVPTPAPA